MNASKIISTDFFSDLTSRFARRRFFTAFVVIFFVTISLVLIGDYLLDFKGSLWDLGKSILTEISAACLIIIISYGIIVFYIGVDEQSNSFRSIRPNDINEGITSLTDGTASYMFWGRSGTFFRASTLKRLVKIARTENKIVTIIVLLPDPLEEKFLKAYADMQAAIGEERDDKKLLLNCIATAVTCSIALKNNKNLRIELYLSKFIPAFRIDLSDQAAFLTRDEPSLSALKFNKESEFFQMFRNMIHNEISLSRKIDLDKDASRGLGLEETSYSMDYLTSFGFNPEDIKGHEASIRRLIADGEHRYK